jgi:hypothetical protein
MKMWPCVLGANFTFQCIQKGVFGMPLCIRQTQKTSIKEPAALAGKLLCYDVLVNPFTVEYMVPRRSQVRHFQSIKAESLRE